MAKDESVHQYKKVLDCLSCLPKNIIQHHSRENISEFVLHGLCGQDCFNLKKAAYFVDNPDFNCIKGVTGFCKSEVNLDWKEIWDDPESFSLLAKSSPFNQKVRAFSATSTKKSKDPVEQFLSKISKDIGFTNPDYCSWNTKHSNHGILVFEKGDSTNELFDEHFVNSLHLLGFCPIF